MAAPNHTGRLRCIDIYAIQRDVGSRILFCDDFNYSVCRRAAFSLLDDRRSVCLCCSTLRHGLAVFCGTDDDISIINKPFSCQRRDRQGDCQQQGEGEREESSFHAVSSCVCIPYPAGRRTGIAREGTSGAMGYPIADKLACQLLGSCAKHIRYPAK